MPLVQIQLSERLLSTTLESCFDLRGIIPLQPPRAAQYRVFYRAISIALQEMEAGVTAPVSECIMRMTSSDRGTSHDRFPKDCNALATVERQLISS